MDVTRIWIHQVRNFGRSIIPDQLISLIFIMIQIIKKMFTQHVQQIKRHVLHKTSFLFQFGSNGSILWKEKEKDFSSNMGWVLTLR